jgi:sugar lactone lactonase YvrE
LILCALALAIAVFSLAGCDFIEDLYHPGRDDDTPSGPMVSTLAGSTEGYADGTGAAAQFDSLSGIAVDDGNLYVGDRANYRIRKIVIATGAVTTFAGNTHGYADGRGTAAQFEDPQGIAVVGGDLYVADANSQRIRKIVIATGAVTTLAGNHNAGYADGTGTAAQFRSPTGIAADGRNLYVTDLNNHRIRKIVIASGAVTTLAGNDNPGWLDATGTMAQFLSPTGIAADGDGNLYVADSDNHRIRKIVIDTKAVTTLAGSSRGYADGTGTAAKFNTPSGIAVYDGVLYVADQGNHRIRTIEIASGAVTTYAGSAQGYADGAGTAAQFNAPYHIAVYGGKLYVTDNGNHRIRVITPP